MDLRQQKKDQIFLLFAISRLSGLILWHRVTWLRTIEEMQSFLDDVKAHATLTGLVYTDGFEPYRHLDYGHAHHFVGKGKSQTFTVEGFHAGTRHYLARLRRKTRCVTRSVTALQKAIDLYVFCHNTRKRKQLFENITVDFTYALTLLV